MAYANVPLLRQSYSIFHVDVVHTIFSPVVRCVATRQSVSFIKYEADPHPED
ncbi:hypothetical protein QUA82_28565 [Microcoleus sp. F8-D3]